MFTLTEKTRTNLLEQSQTCNAFSCLNHAGVINQRQTPQIYDVVTIRTEFLLEI